MQFSAFITAGLIGLASLASQHPSFQARFTPVVQSDRSGQTVVVDALHLTDGRADGYRDRAPRATSTFKRGDQIHIYIEPRNFVTRYEDGHVKAALTIGIEVRDSDAKVISRSDSAWKLPYNVMAPSHLPLTNVYAAFSTTPINLDPGRYKVTLRVLDDLNGNFSLRSFEIVVEAPSAKPVERTVGVGMGLEARDTRNLR